MQTETKMNREQLACAAGFYNGEGSLCYSRGYVQLQVTQTALDPLEQFQKAIGFGSINGPYKNKTYKVRWYYGVYGFEKCQAIIAMLWEWLSIDKRQQAKRVFKQFRSKEK